MDDDLYLAALLHEARTLMDDSTPPEPALFTSSR